MEQSEYSIAYLRQLLESSEQEKKELAARLEEERRKVEDLQFRLEEESIIKDHYKSRSEHTEGNSDLEENKIELYNDKGEDKRKNGEVVIPDEHEVDKDEMIRQLQKEVDSRESEMMQMNATLQETQLKLEQLEDSYVNRNKINNRISELQEENRLLVKEKEQILERWEEEERVKFLLEEERDQLLREKTEQQATVSDRDLQVAQLKAEVERLRLEFSQHKEDLKQQLELTEMETKAMQDLHQQLELERDALDDLHNELRDTTNERDQLTRDLTNLRNDYDLLKQSLKQNGQVAR